MRYDAEFAEKLELEIYNRFGYLDANFAISMACLAHETYLDKESEGVELDA